MSFVKAVDIAVQFVQNKLFFCLMIIMIMGIIMLLLTTPKSV